MFKKVVLFVTALGTLSFASGVALADEGANCTEGVQRTVVNIQECVLVHGQPKNNAGTVNGSSKDNFISRKDREQEETRFPEAKQVKEKYRPQMLQIRASIKEIRGRMAKELTVDNPNKATVKNYINQLAELRRKQQMLLVDQMFETLERLPKEKRADYIQPIVEHCLR